MYHYIHHSADAMHGGTLHCDVAIIREELLELRRELSEAEAHLKECEERKEELVLLLTADTDTELIAELADIVAECEEEKESVAAILDRVEALSEELSESLWWLHRTTA
jgi:predicted  nucleic acid-binding Zn-ribbon protein